MVAWTEEPTAVASEREQDERREGKVNASGGMGERRRRRLNRATIVGRGEYCA